jgi:hypothetical protein
MLLQTYTAPSILGSSLISHSILIDDPLLLGQTNLNLEFALYPGSPASGFLDDVTTSQVPEPSTIAIFALGIVGLASRRFKK